MIAGVDGSKKGWVVATESSQGISVEIAESFEAVTQLPKLETIVIDVPIGLTEAEPRECDLLARRMIGKRHSSVFPAPIRPMLDARSYEEACEIWYRANGKRCSKQLYGILPLIREVDGRMMPRLQRRVREGHPEVSFAALAGPGYSVMLSKHDIGGMGQRAALLTDPFANMYEILGKAGLRGIPSIDLLDAFALLWTARRVRSGEANSLPGVPPRDARGLRMEIVY